MAGVTRGEDGLWRCSWAVGPLYEAYHDDEWGRPVRDDNALFEKISLEAFQSGLSWITILRKRPAFRAAFSGFEIGKVAEFDESDVERLLNDAGIVRNRSKIEATIHNARIAVDLRLSVILWSYAPEWRPRREAVPATSPESIAMSKDLRKRGFRFVGPTTAYALMQATGMVDDHHPGCFVDPVT
ncbi:MAG TPA: DNA-3-methyladenine glycosylase I [Candidatus Limnocylindrales bacterium]|nr:DNA-3-methyladenine glycosylase I [Candidatus Limnocylindrales bacterium]